MALDCPALENLLRQRLPDEVLGWAVFRDQHCAEVRCGRILEILRFLRDDPAARFVMLTDLTAVDYLKWPAQLPQPPERFAVIYQLTSLEHNAQLRVKAYVPEERCEIASATELWPAANWAEREVFDMYGIRFQGHPDLRRLLMPDDYQGHPLRKDYPLKGRGERDRFPKHQGTETSGHRVIG